MSEGTAKVGEEADAGREHNLIKGLTSTGGFGKHRDVPDS